MGVLRNDETNERFHLAARTMVGRSRGADLRLSGASISGEHAVISWQGGVWSVRDLASRNHTLHNGRRLKVGVDYPLRRGAALDFGPRGPRWILEDDSEPVPIAISNTGLRRHALDNVLVLPDEEHSWGTVWRENGRWWAQDQHGGERPVLDHDQLVLGGVSWTLRLNEQPAPTVEDGGGLCVADLRLLITESLDGETIHVEARAGETRIDLGLRVHHLLYLRLGEALLADIDEPQAEQGWLYVDELDRRCDLQRYMINKHVARLREQLIENGVVDGSGIIQRQRSTQQIRLAPIPIEIRQR